MLFLQSDIWVTNKSGLRCYVLVVLFVCVFRFFIFLFQCSRNLKCLQAYWVNCLMLYILTTTFSLLIFFFLRLLLYFCRLILFLPLMPICPPICLFSCISFHPASSCISSPHLRHVSFNKIYNVYHSEYLQNSDIRKFGSYLLVTNIKLCIRLKKLIQLP